MRLEAPLAPAVARPQGAFLMQSFDGRTLHLQGDGYEQENKRVRKGLVEVAGY